MKRVHLPIAGITILALSASLVWAGPSYGISGIPSSAPPTYSEQISQLLKSDRSDAGDRTFDSLVATEMALSAVGRREKALVKLQAVAPTETAKADLENTRQVLETLRSLHSDLTSLQHGFHTYRTLTEKAETAAVRGETLPANHAEKTHRSASQIARDLESVAARGAEVAAHVETFNEPGLKILSGLLDQESPALNDVASLCAEPRGDEAVASGARPAEDTSAPMGMGNTPDRP